MPPHPYTVEFLRNRDKDELLREAALARLAHETSLVAPRTWPIDGMRHAARRLLDLFAAGANARRAGRLANS
jgi:hypothetical protein